MRRFTRWIVPAALAGALLGFGTTGADALPGQTLVAFKSWSAQEKLLRDLSVTRDETSGWPAYRVTASDHGIAWSFYALSDGEHVRSERLSVGSNGTDSSDGIRHDGAATDSPFGPRSTDRSSRGTFALRNGSLRSRAGRMPRRLRTIAGADSDMSRPAI